MVNHSFVAFACFLIVLFATSINALPTQMPSKQHPFRFEVSAPKVDTVWTVDTLPTVSWDVSEMPEKSTMDIALLHHERKESILLRRYVPTRLGSTLINLRPETAPGTYSLLLTVYKGRTSTVIGRTLVHNLILMNDPEQELLFLLNTAGEDKIEEEDIPTVESEPVVLKKLNAIQESELVELTHQPTKGNLVLRAPYTVGWTIPKALKDVHHVRVNLLLVNRMDESVRTLASNIDAKAAFMYVFLPEDIPLQTYRIKVEIIGNGRKFSGYTHRFHTSLPAFSARS
ncbi:hypothetical protein BGX27_010467 [Mortierella sp. AM989]|nr:hypothetical protein BGX27_010467 [Mortierella sp. AM989]